MITHPKLKNTSNIRNTYACRNYCSVDGSKFHTDLQSSLLPLIYDITNSSVTSSLDFYFNNLITTISKVIEKHAPLHTASRKQKRVQSKPWLTKGLLTSIKNKQLLYKNFFFGNNEFGKLYYKKYANKLTRVKNLAKKLYYNEAINDKKNNPKELWRFINSVIPSKRFSPSSTATKVDNAENVNPDEISEHFNNYFVETGLSIAKSASANENPDFKSFLKSSVSQIIVLDLPQPIEVFNAINSLNIHKASGCDDISSVFLRLGNEALAPILSLYFGLVFELGIFPKIFKTAKVIPIYKFGSKNLFHNIALSHFCHACPKC